MKPIRLLLLILCLCPLAMYAQNASVGGSVQDPSGAVIPKASVEFRNQDTGIRRQVKTNADGFYQIEGIDPGKYDATVDAAGFKTLTQENIVFHVGDKAQIDFKMHVGASTENVTVDGSGQLLNTTDASVGTVIDRKFVENIPLNGRSFQDLISMTPGVVTQSPQANSAIAVNGDFSVNGQRTESNYFTVDGLSGNTTSAQGGGGATAGVGGTLGGTTALGTTQSLISVDALQEFKVQSSTYSAEYGRSPGGQFSLVTRPGTNAIHGSIFDYLRNNFFDANDWFNDYYSLPTPPLRQNDFGGTLGGPITIPKLYRGTNRTFFFGSYEGLRLTQPIAATIKYVPDSFMREQAVPLMQSILNAFPIQNGLDYGTSANPSLAQFIAAYSVPSRINSTSVRLDHTLSPKLSMFFRYGTTPSSTAARTAFSLLTTSDNTQTFSFGATAQISQTITNEFRLGYARNNTTLRGTLDGFGGAVPIDLVSAMGGSAYPNSYPLVYLDYPSIGLSQLTAPNGSNRGRQWNVVDKSTVAFGTHRVTFGVDYRWIKSPLTPSSPFMYALFTTTQAILSGKPTTPEVIQTSNSTPIFDETALYVQDEWRVRPRLGISLGARWELNPAPHEEHGNDAYTLLGSITNPSTLSVAPQGTPLWKTDWYSFAPRLGVAWTANGRSNWETIVRTGGGVFYDTANQIAALGYTGLGFTAYKVYSGASLPFTATQLNFPISVAAPYTTATVYAFPQHLQAPYSLEWNTSIQQALGRPQSLTISYVGSNGRRLLVSQTLSLSALNSNFSSVRYLPTGITSNYQALQVQFQRSQPHGLQILASYTWSHSIDYGSTANSIPVVRGNSDFDVRNNFQTGVSWDIPKIDRRGATGLILNHWALDGRLNIRGGFPVSLTGTSFYDPTSGSLQYGGLNLVANQSIYSYGSQYPGGRVINKAAFCLPTACTTNPAAARNFVRSFGEAQVNLAARREFPIHDSVSIQFRAETFNIFNHPNFGYVDPTYTDATFGQATKMLNQSLGTVASQYQQGGPRSMQFALKLAF